MLIPNPERLKKHRVYTNLLEKFARIFPFFPVTWDRNTAQIIQKDLFISIIYIYIYIYFFFFGGGGNCGVAFPLMNVRRTFARSTRVPWFDAGFLRTLFGPKHGKPLNISRESLFSYLHKGQFAQNSGLAIVPFWTCLHILVETQKSWYLCLRLRWNIF